MLNRNFYTPENVDRAKYAQIGAVVLTLLVCSYLMFSTVMTLRETWRAENLLREEKKDSANLSRQVAKMKAQLLRQIHPTGDGVEAFAVQFSRWAHAKKIKVESLAPEGTPLSTEIKVGNVQLGTWDTSVVRVQGSAGFEQLMGLLNDIRNSRLPVQLESFALQSAGSSGDGTINFNIVMTVYGRKSGAS